jgi:hypothetical protein
LAAVAVDQETWAALKMAETAVVVVVLVTLTVLAVLLHPDKETRVETPQEVRLITGVLAAAVLEE